MDFSNEPPHSSTKLTILGKEPFNAEPELSVLLEHPLTPVDLVYCRNHSPIKALDGNIFTVRINGEVRRELELNLKDIRSMTRKDVVAALQCAGNRRKMMSEKKNKQSEGLQWREAVICNIRWTGVPLRELLLAAGMKENGQEMHVCFASRVTPCQQDDDYGASIPLTKAMDEDGDVLLAYEMNGQTLPPDHGYPFRLVIPGYSGARWVKWVDLITVSDRESQNFYQQKDYKILPVKVDSHSKADGEAWWSKIPAMQANPLNSVVGDVVLRRSPDPSLVVKGYAIGSVTGQVKAVEVSVDEGKTWTTADITYQEGKWSWILWQANFQIGSVLCTKQENPRQIKIWSQAIDENGTKQPLDCDWNLRGVGYCAVGEKIFDLGSQ